MSAEYGDSYYDYALRFSPSCDDIMPQFKCLPRGGITKRAENASVKLAAADASGRRRPILAIASIFLYRRD